MNHHKDTGPGMACLDEQTSGMRRPGSSFTCIARSCTLCFEDSFSEEHLAHCL